MTDWPAYYLDIVARLAEVGRGLSPDQAEVRVPATPEWTVRQVYAHLAGGTSDALSGRMDGAPGPTWTGRHVAERAVSSMAELIAELQATAPAAAPTLAEARFPALAFDRAVHFADIHEALGLGEPDPDAWEPVLEAMQDRLTALEGTSVGDYEAFRIAFSRRSFAQIEALGVPADVAPTLGLFGPREDDQPRP